MHKAFGAQAGVGEGAAQGLGWFIKSILIINLTSIAFSSTFTHIPLSAAELAALVVLEI
jgi:hypothetical protein